MQLIMILRFRLGGNKELRPYGFGRHVMKVNQLIELLQRLSEKHGISEYDCMYFNTEGLVEVEGIEIDKETETITFV